MFPKFPDYYPIYWQKINVMKNLENFGTHELSSVELTEVNGGFLFLGGLLVGFVATALALLSN